MEATTELKKCLKPHWVWAIAFGSAIGWGSFVLPTDWIAVAGPMGAIIGLLIGALLMMVIGISYGELIKRYPVAGGGFYYAHIAFGPKHAFFCGWFLTLGYVAIVALNASALALLAKFVVPQVATFGEMYTVAGWKVHFGEVAIAITALVFFAWLNKRGGQLSGKSQFVFCLLLIFGAVLVTVGMLLSPETSLKNMQPLFQPDKATWSAIFAIVAIAPWAYVGFESVPQVAEEFDFPPARALALIIAALAMAVLHYALLIVATSIAMPWPELVAQSPEWGTGTVVQGVLGNIGLLSLGVALFMGIATGLNGFYLSTSRLLLAQSREGYLPKAFSRLHPVYRTPVSGIFFTCALCLIAPWFGREVLLWIVDMASIGIAVAYLYTCAAAYKSQKWTADRVRTSALVPIKKLMSLIGMISSLFFLGLLIIPWSPGALGLPSWVALMVWSGLGITFYFHGAQRHARNDQHRFKGS
ncbi:APC family permease [Vreelandella aquamarina]|uniref:Amino acid transporter n=1 Tax=Vreelandella aquamarina TaxID=77097 RepID=A0A1H8LBV6_9GAMM|nr:APC family permease [Halomonas aquamarina]SEO02607.1 Amino acid transporter [Halomonas aquamarina]